MSETAPEPADTATEQQPSGQPASQEQTHQPGESTDWKSHSRSWESKAKRSEKELTALRAEMDSLRQAQMSDAEKAVAKARAEGAAEGRKAALAVAGQRLVEANVRAILAGRREDDEIQALLDSLDTARFLGDDGEPDTKALTAWADRIAPKRNGFPDLGQGRRESAKPTDMNSLIRRAAGV
jgi:hypothetical protein